MEADFRAAQVCDADWQLRSMLMALLVVLLVVAALMSISPHGGSAWAAVAIVAMVLAGVAFAVIAGVRVRAYSRRGIRPYFGTVIAFNLWNTIAVSTSIATRFWAAGQPSYHFGVTELVTSIPLGIGLWTLSRRHG